jgi:hypothetical protein
MLTGGLGSVGLLTSIAQTDLDGITHAEPPLKP